MLRPGSVIGVLGGGQLGRMTALAAAPLGYRVHVYADEPDGPGSQVTSLTTVAAMDDPQALAAFAGSVDVVTYETENVPLEAIRHITPHAPVLPGPHVLEICQDRLKEKDWLRSVGIETAPYREVNDLASLARAVQDLAQPAILKSTRFGYDGKGQVAIGPSTDLAQAWNRIGADAGILEGFVDFRCELSVIVARTQNGSIANYAVAENMHANHILDSTTVPARIAPDVAGRAEAIARHIAERLKVVGLIAVEMFLCDDGRILVNELAPRPHNSGHWTIDACACSQFEQLVRALVGLPLGPTAHHASAVMHNLIGAAVDSWREHASDPATRLHLYGKHEARPGRKMGHYTRLGPAR